MELLYQTDKLLKQCTEMSAAKELFHGDMLLSRSLLARINALESSEVLKDIIVQPQFRFHKLTKTGKRNLEGYFAIDVKTRKEPWRIILQPLDDNKEPFHPCDIDKIAKYVRIVEITEVSNHYE